MALVTDKKIKYFSQLPTIAGFGALWLSIVFLYIASGDEGGFAFDITYTFIYYVCNSILLLLSAWLNRNKFFKFFSLISFVLLFSVLGSLFVSTETANLFIGTVLVGGTAFMVGGTFFVPLFLISVLAVAYKGVLFLTGNLVYAPEDTVTNTTF